jgi:hypothetical protein
VWNSDFLISWLPSPILGFVLSYLPDSVPEFGCALAGCWSAGERLLRLRDQPVWVNVWFHFFDGGEAIASMRYLDRPPSRVHGRWRTEQGTLIARFGGGEIRADFGLDGDVLRWGSDTLLRLPDRTASLPFGIQLPYRLSTSPDSLASAGAMPPLGPALVTEA